MASISYNDTGTALTGEAPIAAVEIDASRRYRLMFQFHSAGIAFALTQRTSRPGHAIQVQFYGKLV